MFGFVFQCLIFEFLEVEFFDNYREGIRCTMHDHFSCTNKYPGNFAFLVLLNLRVEMRPTLAISHSPARSKLLCLSSVSTGTAPAYHPHQTTCQQRSLLDLARKLRTRLNRHNTFRATIPAKFHLVSSFHHSPPPDDTQRKRRKTHVRESERRLATRRVAPADENV